MKVTFKKVLYDELDIDFQKIYDFISKSNNCDDMQYIYEEFMDNAEYYLTQTHDLNSLFASYDLVCFNIDLFKDNESALECIVDNFYVFLRDKFGV
jgi:hypothetical protein